MRKSDPKSLAGRPSEKAKKLGQVLTPPSIAASMVRGLFNGRDDRPVNILDPCVGSYTFPEQLLTQKMLRPKDVITVVDFDAEMIAKTAEWAQTSSVHINSFCSDYLELVLNEQYDYAILNPPYIRQEWIDDKRHYKNLFESRYNLTVPGTSNLYVYFITKVIRDLKVGGRFACILYDSWQSTNFGRWLVKFINAECGSIRLEPIPNQPFHNRLIDATIIYGVRREKQSVLVEGGLSLDIRRGPLSDVEGFCPIESVFSVRRGLRLKQADFFLCSENQPGATPFLKKVGKLEGYSVPQDHAEAALLVTERHADACALAELERRLKLAEQHPSKNISILTWVRERPESWAIHGEPPYAPIVFNYYIRNRPRHILNMGRAYSDNFYGLSIPKQLSPYACLAFLNSTAVCTEILAMARNQGNGLAKIQLFEYRDVFVPNISLLSTQEVETLQILGKELVERPHLSTNTIARIDEFLASIFNDAKLVPSRLKRTFTEIDVRARRPKG